MGEKVVGVVSAIFDNKDFGFLTHDKIERFFHASAVEEDRFPDLKPGDKVEFTPIETPKGPRAVGVRILINTD